MVLSPKEQILDQIRKSETILICIGKNPKGDALGSVLAFCSALKKIGKKVDVASPTAMLEKYSFMPSSELITHKLEGARDYVLSLKIDKEKLQQLRYEVNDHKLRIFITAKDGEFEEKDIAIESSKFKYDLIIILGTPDLESLGNIYDRNPDLFYEIPLANIDHNPSNEYFGKINLIDVTVSSTSEIIFNLISALGENLIDEHIATNLLTGIVSETNSFQNKNTTPKAFLAAASLIASGANKQEIIRHLYRTRSVSMIKLMGEIMSNLKYNSQYKLGWSIVKKDKLGDTSVSYENIGSAIKELANSSPEFDLFILIYKKDDRISGIIDFSEKVPAEDLAKSINGKIENKQIAFSLEEKDFEQAEKNILKKIKDWADGARV